MACRKADIDKYENDIEVLERASTLAQKVVDDESLVSDYLTNLQDYYGKTINASDELINEFHELDKDALSSARNIKIQISGALTTARTLLSQARLEEESCEEHNPKQEG